MRLGEACHDVLDRAVAAGILRDQDWHDRVSELWDEEVLRQQSDAEGDGAGLARIWPGYQLKRARLFRVAALVREVLLAAPAHAEILTEQPLAAYGGRLFGRPDLIVRSEGSHRIIDYKSGGILDRETQQPRESYVRQLQLYAYLEHEASGGWPETAHLFPLHGAPVEVDVDPEACRAVAEAAIEALEAYNAAAPGTQPARPAPETCGMCSFAADCPAFWKAYSPEWANSVLAAAGVVGRVVITPLGGTTIELSATDGSITGPLVIRNIDGSEHPAAYAAAPGVEAAAVGFVREDGRESCRLPPWGLLSVRDADTSTGAATGVG